MNAGVKDEHFINDERWNKTIAIVVALAKLHNFCINEVYDYLQDPLQQDEQNIIANEFGYVPLIHNAEADEVLNINIGTPEGLVRGGEHFGDTPRQCRRMAECDQPQQDLFFQVINSHKTRPRRKGL